MSHYINLNLSQGTFNEIINIIEHDTLNLENYGDIEEHVMLVKLLNDCESEDIRSLNDGWKREVTNTGYLDELEDDYGDFIKSLVDRFGLEWFKVRLFLLDYIHLFHGWDYKYLLVSCFFYLGSRDSIDDVGVLLDLVGDFGLSLEELLFFYNTILNCGD